MFRKLSPTISRSKTMLQSYAAWMRPSNVADTLSLAVAKSAGGTARPMPSGLQTGTRQIEAPKISGV
jgi:hypothetical protein